MREEEWSGNGGRRKEAEDGGYRRGRHRWQHPEQQHQDPKRLCRVPGAPPNVPFVPNPSRGPSNQFGNPSGAPPNGPFLPGTGRFLPPLERKLLFPFKNNPQHRAFIWGPSSGPQGPGEEGQDNAVEPPSFSESVPSFQASHAPQGGPGPRGQGSNSYRHQQQRRNHHQGNRNHHGNQRNNRQRSRQKGRNPFDGYVERANEQAGQDRHANPNQGFQQQQQQHHQGGRMRYNWHNPGSDLQDKHGGSNSQNWRGGDDGQQRPSERPRSGVSPRGLLAQQQQQQDEASKRNSRVEEPMEA